MAASNPRGELIPLSKQLSGAVGGRASSALISIVKASLRAVFRGGSFVDGCGTAAQTVLRRCLRLLRRVVRPGGEGACVTTLLEMPFGAQRQNFCDAMRDLVVSPAMGVSTLEPGVVWTRE